MRTMRVRDVGRLAQVRAADATLAAAKVALPDEAVRRLDEASAAPLGYPYEMIKGVQGRW